MNKVVIPLAGRLVKRTLASKNEALYFTINKGYFETDNADIMFDLIDVVKDIESIILVGKVECIRYSENKKIVFRQRIYFEQLNIILNICNAFSLAFEVGKDFKINTNSLLECLDFVPYLGHYASLNNEDIDTWLTNCLLFTLLGKVKDLGIEHNISIKSKRKRKYYKGSPFLLEGEDTYSFIDSSILASGFTVKTVNNDLRGFLHENKNR